MKQLLLTLGMAVALCGGLLAQDVIWTEDFSDGLNGWTQNNPACDNYQGGDYGTWQATSATVAGQALDLAGTTLEWTFINPLEYSVNFYDAAGTFYFSTVSRYTLSGDTLQSVIEASEVTEGISAEYSTDATSRVIWSSVVSPGASLAIVNQINGTNNPLITIDGTSMTYTSQDGLTVVNFERSSQCPNLWRWTPNGNWTAGFGVETLSFGSTILSATAANGSVIADSYMQISLGDPNFNAGNPPYPEFVSELISPAIDISAANSGLSLQWTQAYATVNAADDAPGGFRTSFSVSVDDGASWSAPIDMNAGAAGNTIFRNGGDLAIPANLIGGATEIRLKLTMAQDFYFFGLDDLVLVERNPYEMQANENFYAIAPNYETPYSQLSPIAFMADIQNNGGATAENVNLNITIFDEGANAVHTGDLAYGDIAPDSLAENSIIPGMLDLATESSSVGRYVGIYALTHDSVASESNTLNDSLAFDFWVTDTLFSKAPASTRGISPADSDSYLFGNVFYVPNGTGWFARTITFEVTNAADIATYQNNTATVLLYQWDGDTNQDGAMNPEEYTTISFFEHTFDGTETGAISVPVLDILEGEPIALEDDKYYVPVVQFVSADPTADNRYSIASADNYDYSAAVFVSDSLENNGLMPEYFGPVLEVGDPAGEDVTFSTVGFGRQFVPMVTMSIGLNGDLSMDPLIGPDNVDELPANYEVATFPNPATEYFTLNMDLPEMQDVAVTVYDLKGQTLFFQKYDDMQTGSFRYEVADLPAGMYFVRVSTDAGARTLKVNVQH